MAIRDQILKKRLLVIALAVIFIVPFHAAVSYAAEDPQTLLENLWKQIQQVVSEKNSYSSTDMIEEALARHYDFDTFYEKALADHWPSWTDMQKSEFDARFRKIFLTTLARKIGKVPTNDVSLAFEHQAEAKDRAVLHAVGEKGEKEVRFKTFFINRKGVWKIYDVEIEGALLSRNYRGQFNRILRRENYSGLLAKLDKKLQKQGEKS